MASFSITDYTHESVTIAVSGITSGQTVWYFVRLADETSATISETYTATGTSMTKTFDGLSASTAYVANVCIYTTSSSVDGEWIGAQDFITEERPKVVDGKIVNVPILATSYPLFDWSDWALSYAALVPDGLTSEFEKECWNAIIDHLNTALTAAGITWNTTYTTAADAKITEEYGDLYAKAFNSVRYNIDRPAPLGWAWANNSSFRGYVGRADFRGVSQYGESGADDVYADYIPELVRKLNLLIEIMRCSGSHVGAFGAEALAVTDQYVKARQGIGFEIGNGSGVSFTDYVNSGIHVGIGARAIPVLRSSSTDHTNPGSLGYGVRAVPVLKSVSTDCTTPGARLGRGVRINPAWSVVTTSQSKALILYGWPVYVEADKQNNSTTQHDTTVRSGPAAPVSGSDCTKTCGGGTVRAAGTLRVKSKEIARSNVQTTVRPTETLRVKAKECVTTPTDAVVTTGQSARVLFAGSSVVPYTKVTIYSAWEPPIWVDGGLWIRQVHDDPVQNEDGSLEVT